jgi:hypothetical protein
MSDSFESLLARTEHRDAAPAGACPDAEVLAAYLDATLTRAERAGVEAHAADCARCALQLATLVRLEDISGTPQHAPVRRWWPRLAWMVPAATAIVVGAVYVALPSPGGPAAPPPPQPATLEAQQRATLDDRVERKELEVWNRLAPGKLLEESHRTLPAPSTSSAKGIQPAAPPPALAADAPTRESKAPATGGASVGNAAARDLASTEGELHRKAEGQPAAPRESDLRVDASSPARITAVAERGAAESANSQLPLVVRSPDARVQWRAVDDRLERSTDGGRTWIAERAPAPEAITMGAAPSSEICWMAAASGQVLRRTEDGAWVDVSPVPRLSIVRLEVSAVLDAVVMDASGAAVKTADGGRTWMR